MLVEAHHNALNFANGRKELPDLLLPREEGQVANVDSGRRLESMLVLFWGATPIATGVGGIFRRELIQMGHV